MKLIKLSILSICFVVFNGCTVLGFATDMALISAIEDDTCKNSSSRANCRANNKTALGDLLFTELGLEQDVKIVKKVMEQIDETKNEELVEPENVIPTPEKPPVVACKKVTNGQQQCYSADYYKDMYITEE
ncbi:hypothetical protein L0668_05980 [Paraglaciecola aquimarina]|uniref:Lipoprotein n=1 Tax=Paraglaciecola algarum TaxID=3050085 RepID=A0ABS9D6J4_9ALTE|nr:hypothetical protein [Paraglaciecola sp. G1-23]MCF2947647.1 hypothetical protein [Paraglaciecola sp. G1-23]